eukprot:719716-Prorocentrum_lima.AAC.1
MPTETSSTTTMPNYWNASKRTREHCYSKHADLTMDDERYATLVVVHGMSSFVRVGAPKNKTPEEKIAKALL